MGNKGGRRASFVFIALYLTAVTALLYLAFSDWAYDDPYITYRYAENLASGEGFVYNPGERVLSTTTPLFTLILAILRPVVVDLHQAAVLIGAASIGAGALLLWDLSRTWKTPLVGWTALALFPTSPLIVSTLSSETPLYVALCLGALAAYARREILPAALLVSLAALARPDGLILAGILVVHHIITARGSVSWKAAIVFTLPLLAWAAFAWIYFGSPVPATLAAKQGQGLLPASRSFLAGSIEVLRGYSERVWAVLPAILAGIGLICLNRRRHWALFLAWPATYFLAFMLLGVASYFWYYAPLAPGLIVLVGLGVDGLAAWLAGRRPSLDRASRLLAISLIAVIAAFQLADLEAMRQAPDPRRAVYQAVGEWLSQDAPRDALVGTLEVGIIGYYARSPMLDFSGLIQPDVARIFSSGSSYEESAIWAVEAYRPAFLILHRGLMPRLEAGFAQDHCLALLNIPGRDYGYSQDLVLYDCR